MAKDRREYLKAYHQKKREDPGWLEKRRKQNRESIAKAKKDPEVRKQVNDVWVRNHRERLEKDPDYRERRNASARGKYRRDKYTKPDSQRLKSLRHQCKLFGIDIHEFNRMFEEQQGLCAVCKRPEQRMYKGKVKRIAIDHCHKSGKARELLCADCNTALGLLEDNIGRLQSCIEYLQKHKN